MSIEVKVVNPTRNMPQTLREGDELAFGRAPGGVGHLGDQRRISRHHGVIGVDSMGAWITCTSRAAGFQIADGSTASLLIVRAGAGPVRVPFREWRVVVDHEDGRSILNVTVTGSDAADNWERGPSRPTKVTRHEHALPGTAPPLGLQVRTRKTNGVHYTWFWTLVALCEPLLDDPRAKVPTKRELARRRLVDVKTVEAHITAIYKAFQEKPGDLSLQVIAELAVRDGLVTASDVAQLP